MTRPGFTLINPPIVQQAVTGLYMAGERTIRGKAWRVDISTRGAVALSRDGQPVAFGDAPRDAQLFHNDVVQFANAMAALDRGAA